MNDFSEGIKEGQDETKEALRSIRSGNGVSNDYAFKLSKRFLLLGFIGGIVSFIISLLYFHLNFVISVIIGIISGYLLFIMFAILIVGIFKLASKSDKYKAKI